MVMVDSSVWIDLLNGKESAQLFRLRDLLSEKQATLNDLIFYEVTSGIASDREFEVVTGFLKGIGIIATDLCILSGEAAHYYRTLRKQGITIRKTVDVLIATQCIRLGIPLLHHDRDFEPFEQFGLQVHQ